MGKWQLFADGLIIVGIIGVVAALLTPKINKAMEKVEYYANGHVTEHHTYQPFD